MVSTVRGLGLLAAAVVVVLLISFSDQHQAQAVFHLVQIDEVMTGANGSTDVQFVEMRMCCLGQNTQVDNARLEFFDAAGNKTGEFLFLTTTPPSGNNVSFLTATQAFDDLPETPTPDFIMPAGSLTPGSGKVCYSNVPFPPAGFIVTMCLSYGDFTGDTNGSGTPAPTLPATGAASLKRFQNFAAFETNQFNADFQIGSAQPTNGAGETGTVNITLTPTPVPGIAEWGLIGMAAAFLVLLLFGMRRRARARRDIAPG